jgi:hypothetical protein
LAFARRRVFATVGASAQARRDERRQRSSHDACVQAHADAIAAAEAARTMAARQLDRELSSVARAWREFNSAIDRAERAFAPLASERAPTTPTVPEEEVVVQRLLDRFLAFAEEGEE